MKQTYVVPYYRLAPSPPADPREDLVPVDHHVLLVRATDRAAAMVAACFYFLGKGHVSRLEPACGFTESDVAKAGLPRLVQVPATSYMPGDLVIEPAATITLPPIHSDGEVIEPPKRKR